MARMDARDELRYYEDAKQTRTAKENDYRLSSAYCLPEHYGAWQTEGPASVNGIQTVRRQVFDSTGMRSLPKYASVLQRLVTPDGVRFQTLSPSDKTLLKSLRVKQYFEQVTSLLFDYRMASRARFKIATGEVYSSIGCYGTGPMYLGKRQPNAVYKMPSFLYKGCLLRDIFILTNDDDEIIAVYRRFFLTRRQFMFKFPDMPLPKSLQSVTTGSEGVAQEFVHVVRVRQTNEHDEEALDARRHPVCGSYIAVKDGTYVGEEHGFRSIPYLTPRTFTVPGDPYGFSPASRVISSMGGASTMRKTHLKQGNIAAQPVLLAYDDGVMNGEVDMRPGAVNPGGLDAQGRYLIRPLESGNFNVSEKLLEEERLDIEDSFFVTLFQILNETPEMTATEVIERVAEKTALLAPTMGRMQSEFLGPCTEREIDLLAEMGLMPPLPPELVEAKGQYDIEYTSPMAKGIHADEAAGFVRTVEMAIGITQATGDPSALDVFDFDTAIPEIADIQGTPARWMASPDKIAATRDARAKAQEQQQLVQNAGGLAQAAKAANDIQQPAMRQKRA